jgi:hypothetical protein
MSDEVPSVAMFANELPAHRREKTSTTPINGDLPKFTGTNPATPGAERMTGVVSVRREMKQRERG